MNSTMASVISESRKIAEAAENTGIKMSKRPSINRKSSGTLLENNKEEKLPELKASKGKR